MSTTTGTSGPTLVPAPDRTPAPTSGHEVEASGTASTCPRPPAAPAAREPGAPDHVRMGVGARLTLHPAADDVVPVILGALEAAAVAAPGLTVRTDDVSTLVRGPEQEIASWVVALVSTAAAATPSGHVVATLALSRGCPGEVGCVLPEGELAAVAPVDLAPAGVAASAHWALYPLGTQDAMGPIEHAISLAQQAGTWSRPENFATRLDGDLSAVVATLLDTWSAVGREVAHVAAHATISVGSPSARTARSADATGAADAADADVRVQR